MSIQRCTPEFKEEAVRQVIDRGYSVAEVAARLGVSPHSLHKWVKAVNPPKNEQQTDELVEAKSEILRLRAQMRRPEVERDLLKKPRLLRCRPQMKYGFIVRHRAIWPTRTMCRVLGVSASGFYDWLDRPTRAPSDERARN